MVSTNLVHTGQSVLNFPELLKGYRTSHFVYTISILFPVTERLNTLNKMKKARLEVFTFKNERMGRNKGMTRLTIYRVEVFLSINSDT